MNNQNFKLKKNQLINWPFRSSQFFTAAGGISDATAIEYLTADLRRLDKFASYPGSDSESKQLDLTLIGIDPDAPVIAPPVTPEFVVIDTFDTFDKVKEKYNIVISGNRLRDIHTLGMISAENALDMSDEELDLVDAELERLGSEQEAFEIETIQGYEIEGEAMSAETVQKIIDDHKSEFTGFRVLQLEKNIASRGETEKKVITEPVKTGISAAKPLNRMNKKELSAEYEKEFLTPPPEELTVKDLLKKLTNK